MKKLLIAIAVLVVVAVAAAGIFLATFDVNKYKGLIESKAGEALRSQVKIGSIKLTLTNSLAVEIRGLSIFEEGKEAPALYVDRTQVSLKLLPLLRKSIEVGAVTVDQPRLIVVREAGVVRVLGVNPLSKNAKSELSSQTSAAMPALAFAISQVKITEGEIDYRDLMVTPASQTIVKHLNVTLKDVSLAGPIRFDADAAVFGDKTDVRLQGEATDLAGGKPELRNFTAAIDLGLMDHGLLARAVPAVKQAGLREDFGGKIEARVDRVVLGPSGPEDLSVKLKVTDGRVGLTAVKPYFENIRLDASVDDKSVQIDDLSLQFSGGTVKAKGAVQDYRQTPRSQVELAVQGVRIDPFVPVTSEGKALVEGAVSLAFKGSASGAAWPEISRTLNGEAALEFQQGVKLNLNIIRELLGKLSMFPGLVSTLEKNLPESYRPKLTQQSTILNSLRHTFPIRDGAVQIRDLQVSTDFFSARLDADAQLSGALDGNGTVQLDQTFSKGMLDGFPQTELLANSVSQIELPLILKYAEGKFSVLPDVEKIIRNLAAGGGAKALSGLLSGMAEKSSTDAAQQPASQETAPAKKDKISSWLSKI